MARKKRYYAEGEMQKGYRTDPRRRQEYEDSMMISEDHTAPSNLPQDVIHKYYTKNPSGMDENLDDTIKGVDEQISEDVREARKYKSEEKY